MRIALAIAALSLLAPATAADAAATLKAQNAALVAATPHGPDIFAVQDDGAVRHPASGIVCPAKYPNVDFYGVLVYRPDGTDAGCDYRRADDLGGAWAKLTIFMVRFPAPITIDQAFANYRAELLQVQPDAKSQGEALRIGNKSEASPLPPIRSEEFLVPMNGQTYTTELYVAQSNGWIIEVRTSFVGQPNVVDPAREGPNSAVNETGDRLMGPKALFDALGRLGN